MKLLTQEEIQILITCEKKITDPPKKELLLRNRNLQNNFKALSEDTEHEFIIFIRQSDEFPENFSIGLRYINHEGTDFMLYRCNGPHGETETKEYDAEPHVGYHEHTLIRGVKTMLSKGSAHFGSFHDAIAYFIQNCNILGAEEYFPFIANNESEQLEFDL